MPAAAGISRTQSTAEPAHRRASTASIVSAVVASERVSRIAELLHEAAETHHTVYRITDGDDPDWASWYADWLLDLSELPELLGAPSGAEPPRARPRRARPRLHGGATLRALGGLVRGASRRDARAGIAGAQAPHPGRMRARASCTWRCPSRLVPEDRHDRREHHDEEADREVHPGDGDRTARASTAALPARRERWNGSRWRVKEA